MDDGAPGLEVGFEIDTTGSFDSLARLDTALDKATSDAIAEVAKVEKAIGGMLNMGKATASVATFGNAATRELQTAAREMGRVEKSGEAMVRQLERQNAAFGKTREELRFLKSEAAAAAAESQGLTELAARIRAAEADLAGQELAAARRARFAAEEIAESRALAEAQAARQAALDRAASEAAVVAQLRERAQLEAAIERNTGVGRIRAVDAGATFSALAAREAAAEAREKDLAAAATKRLADEQARLTKMVRDSHAAQQADHASLERLRQSTDPLYAATSRLNAEIAESTRLYHAGLTPPTEYARQQAVLADRLRQAEQAHGSFNTTARRGTGTLTQLSFQVNDVATMAMSGASAFQIFATQAGQFVQVVQQAEGGLRGVAGEVGGLMMRFGPLIAVVALAAGGFALFDRAVSKGIDTKGMVNSLGLTRDEIKRLKDTSVDTGDVVKATFQVMAQRVGLDLKSMTGYFGVALDWMTTAGRVTLAALYSQFVGTFRAIGAIVRGVFDGKGIGEILADVGNSYKGAFDEANSSMKRFGADVRKQIESNKLADLRKQAAELKKDRTPKTDRHAEQLAREALATEAQIRNLYDLADAYGVSGAAALIAEARVKAESKAIKQRADIDAAVNRQVRLSIAQRVSDAAKSSAAMRQEAEILTVVNAEVANGLVPAERAAELVRQRIAELPLLAAIEAAQQRGLTAEVEKATAALKAQRDAQVGSDAAGKGQFFAAADQQYERRLAVLREEATLIGATDEQRARVAARIQAEQDLLARGYSLTDAYATNYIAQQVEIADQTFRNTQAQRDYTDALTLTADKWDLIADRVQSAASGMADAFGNVGRAIGDLASTYASFEADRARLQQQHDAAIKAAGTSEAAIARENQLFALRSSGLQVQAYGDMAAAAKGFFKEGTSGYQALQKAEQIFRTVQFALSVRAMAQDLVETGSKLANGAARIAVGATEAVVNAIKSLPFPLNLAAGAATVAALASIGVAIGGSFGGGGSKPAPSNTGTGTVLGDSAAQSQSIARSIDALRQVDTLMLAQSREMAASLRSIDAQIGGFTAQILRAGDIDASAGVDVGFKGNLLGGILAGPLNGIASKIPVIGGLFSAIGGFINSLFGSTTKITGNGLFGGPQSLSSILGSGFDASYYSDIEKTSKFLGIKTGTSYDTKYTDAAPELEQQFTLILRSFSDAIGAAAGPLDVATADIQSRLAGFVVDIGKIDLKGLTGEQIQEKLSAVFGAAADRMAEAAIPGFTRFQRAGEGAFETLIRVASTVETVTYALDQMGGSATSLSIDAKMGLAGHFESLSDLQSAVSGYLDAFFTPAERAQAQAAQLGRVFGSLGLTMPDTIAGFRQLVEAQDLSTAAGQETYATLLQLAPAFAELQAALNGAKSAADVLAERGDLQRRLLELQGNTAALRALDLAKLDASNRALQEQIWAIEDAQEAARAADELRQAWQSVGNSIRDEVARIRGIANDGAPGGFALAQGRFNAAVLAAQAGDQKAAESLPGLSQALLTSAEAVATSQQELARIRAATAATLDSVAGWIDVNPGATPAATTTEQLLTAIAANTAATAPAANDDTASEIRALREEVAQLRADNNAGHAATAGNTGRMAKKLDDVTAASGGNAVSVQAA